MKQPLKIILQIFAAVYGSIACLIIWSFIPKWIGQPEITDKFWYHLTNGFFLFTLFIGPFILAIRHTWQPIKNYLSLIGKKKNPDGKKLKAEAVVLEIGESHSGTATINNQPYVRLKLAIHHRNEKPYVVSIESVIPRLSIQDFQPGCKTPVLIDKNNPDKVEIDFR